MSQEIKQISLKQYKALCKACDRILLMPNSTLERVCISWLHVIRPHSVYLINYYDIFYSSSVGRFFLTFKQKTKYILTMDADGELPVKNIPKIINMIKRKKYDLIVGKRSNFNRFSENLLDKIFRSKFGLKDPISGFKLYKLKSLKKIIKFMYYINYKKF